MASFSDLVVKLELQQAAFQKGMDQAARQLARVQQSAKGTQSALGGLESGLKAVTTAAAAMGTAFAAIKSLTAIAQASDQLRNLQGSFAALLGDAGRASDMMGRVFGVVERTGVPLEAAASSMQRLTIAMGQLGASNHQIETVAETFIQLGKVGGSSASETAAALQQLGQALASGKLGGDELKSIRENAPLVAEAIAQALGVTSGELKQLGEDGKLTADVVANALIAASDKAGAAFAKLPQSLEQATNKMELQATLAAAAFDKIGGTTTTLVTTVNAVADTLHRWTTELEQSGQRLNSLQLIAELVGDAARLTAVAFVAIGFAIEQVAKRVAFFADQLDLLVHLDFAGITESTRKWREQFDAAAEATDIVIRNLLRMPVPQLQTGETGGEPVIPPRKLKPAPGGAGAGGKGKGDAEREAEALRKRGEALAASVDAQEAYNQKLREYDELLGKGAITQAIFEKAVSKAREELTAQGDALKASVDPFFAHALEVEKINQAYRDGQIEIEHWLALMEEANQKLADATKKPKTELEKLADAAADAIGSGIGDFFTAMISGSESVDKAFAKMVKSIVTQLAKLLAEFAAKKASEFIISSLTGGGSSVKVGGNAAAPSLMLASRPTTWNAAASLAGPLALGAPRAGTVPGATTGGAGAASSPWNVVINNNAPGVDVTAAPRDGGLEVTVERVRSLLAQDIVRGGNAVSRSLESAYGLGRGR